MLNTLKTKIFYFLAFSLTLFSSSIANILNAEEPFHPVAMETGFYYTVKKGDTLWDLSKRFSDSPWIWPELWSENKQLSNPHRIYPGQKIRLYLRKDITKAAIPVKAETEIPPESVNEMPTFFYPKIDMVGFIKKEAVRQSGAIIKVKDDKEMISQNDLIFVKPSDGETFSLGARFFIYRTFDPLKDKKNIYGIQHYITGIAEIKEVKTDYALANVTHSFRPIKVRDMLMPYMKRTPYIHLSKSVKSLEGTIIISEERSNYFGDNTIAFIDKGIKEGVKEGQMYHVYYEEETPVDRKGKQITRTPITYGTVLVLQTEADTATVLITSSKRDMHPGTKIHVDYN